MPQITYAHLITLRNESNAKLYAVETTASYELSSLDSDQIAITTSMPKTILDTVANDGSMIVNPALAAFLTNVLPYCNVPMPASEVRFETHDYSDKSDWCGRTHGDQVAYLAGGYLKHPVDGSWLDATGASMIAAYGTPSDAHYGDPTYLFGAWAHRITAKYDDVKYEWWNANHTVRYAWLDSSVTPKVWKNDTGTIVVHYSGTDWVRNDTSAVVTSSLWRILPYSNFKIQINKVKTTLDVTTVFTGTLHYQVYMDLAAGVAGAGYPAGNYQVADWQYASVTQLLAGSDGDPLVLPDVLAGHTAKSMIISYNYKDATVAPVIDSQHNMHLDISLSTNQPVTGTVGASATFICLKLASF